MFAKDHHSLIPYSFIKVQHHIFCAASTASSTKFRKKKEGGDGVTPSLLNVGLRESTITSGYPDRLSGCNLSSLQGIEDQNIIVNSPSHLLDLLL